MKTEKNSGDTGENLRGESARAAFLAIAAAALFGICAPVSKILLAGLSPALMASLLYLGAGCGMLIIQIIGAFGKRQRMEAKITRKELPYLTAMVLLDVAAPILLMFGLAASAASSVSLLSNFEIAATAAVAMIFFKEPLGKRMWLAVLLITASCVLLSLADLYNFKLSAGSFFVIAACLCWGFENNCTRMLSLKDPLQIVIIKGFGSGIVALLIAAAAKGLYGSLSYILPALLLGFVSYGLSIYFYISAQRRLGAARTSIYYAAAPFIGVLISWTVLREPITGTFLTALAIMAAGTYFAISEKHKHPHTHQEETHEHRHRHDDGHHNHRHDEIIIGEHSHEHTHEGLQHTHTHTPELHHRHAH
jgi:Permeases of the drug/metabolite transporter (DMT) superfamily